MKTKPPEDRHCKECGELMIVTESPAERFEFMGLIPGDKYDAQTGKRCYRLHYKCPNICWLRFGHETYATGKIILRDE